MPLSVAKMSGLVRDSMEGEDDDNSSGSDNDGDDDGEVKEIPLPNVSGDVLEKVVDFCRHYALEEAMTEIQTPLRSPKLEELVQEWYADYVKVERTMLFDLVAAANFMDIKPLLDLTCLAVSILIKGKSAGELREMFNLTAEVPAPEQQQQNAEGQLPPAAADAASGGD